MSSYDFSNCKNGLEFVTKNNLTFDEAIKILDFEIIRLKKELNREGERCQEVQVL